MGRFNRFPASCKSSSNTSPGFILQYIFVLHPPFRFSSLLVWAGLQDLLACLVHKRFCSSSIIWKKLISDARCMALECSRPSSPYLLSSSSPSPPSTSPTPDGASSLPCFSPRALSSFWSSWPTSFWRETSHEPPSSQSAAPRQMTLDLVGCFCPKSQTPWYSPRSAYPDNSVWSTPSSGGSDLPYCPHLPSFSQPHWVCPSRAWQRQSQRKGRKGGFQREISSRHSL